jgi:hypothetical protein
MSQVSLETTQRKHTQHPPCWDPYAHPTRATSDQAAARCIQMSDLFGPLILLLPQDYLNTSPERVRSTSPLTARLKVRA